MLNNLTLLPLTLKWDQLKIRPTRYGIVFVLLLIGMFAGSVNYNNNLGFLLTFLLGGMAFVSIAHTYKNISGISVLSCSCRPVFAAEPAVFEIVIGDPLTVRNGIRCHFQAGNPATLDLSPGARNRITVGIHAASRGLLKPGTLTLFSEYPLGLFRVQASVAPDCQCIVYPRPKAGKLKPSTGIFDAESDLGITGSGTDDFQGLKTYTPGDPLQRISWKASSRGRGLFTKEFNGHQRKAQVLDWDLLPARDKENRLSVLCQAVLDAQQHNLTYGLQLPGVTIAPGSGDLHKRRCLKALALYDG